ncbi:MAG TPA: response regulator, partial [Thermoanaerobaculia bacterium]
ENILLNKDNVAFITDFGIATTADRVRRREIAGTPDYMSPEQLRSEDVAPASDLYSCGVLLYRMLEGVLPFRATTMHGMIAAHLNDAPDPIGGEREVSAATRELVNWMLQKRMSDRPQNANELLEKIDFQLNRERTRSASQRVTVLLAEADPDALEAVKSVLEGDGFKVLATSSAREAVNAAFEHTPSVIMLDAGIRDGFELSLAEGDAPAGADGLGFCRIVRADDKLRRVPIIVMSDPSESALKNEFSQCGAAEFVLKPLAPAEIISAVQRVRVAAMGAS